MQSGPPSTTTDENKLSVEARLQLAEHPPETLQDCLYIPGALFFFTKFLVQERSEENIELWHAVNMFLKKSELLRADATPAPDPHPAPKDPSAAARQALELKRIEEEGKQLELDLCADAQAIVTKFIGVDAPRQVNINDGTERKIRESLAIPDIKKRVAALKESLKLCQTQIFKLLSADSFRRFTRSDCWKEFLSGATEQTATPANSGTADDPKALFPMHLSYDEMCKNEAKDGNVMSKILFNNDDEEDYSSLLKKGAARPYAYRSAAPSTASSSSSSSSSSSAFPSSEAPRGAVSPRTTSAVHSGTFGAFKLPTAADLDGLRGAPPPARGRPAATDLRPPLSSPSGSPTPSPGPGSPRAKGTLKYSGATLDFLTVSERANTGQRELGLFKDFSAKLVKSEQSYIKKLEKLFVDDYKKLGKSVGDAGMRSLWMDIGTMLSERLRIAGLALDVLNEQVLNPLTALEKQNAAALKSIATTMKKLEGDMRKASEVVQKGKDECLRALQSVQALQDRERAEKVDTKKLALQNQIKPLLQKSTEQMQLVLPRIEEANKQQALFLSGVGSQLDALQELDTKRVTGVSSSLTQWMASQNQRDLGMAAAGDTLLANLKAFDAEQCIQWNINDWLFDSGPKVALEPYAYDLPLTPSDVQEGYVLGGHVDWNGDSSVTLKLNFGVPVTQILKREKTEGKEVPIVLLSLCDTIRANGGVQADEIFRKNSDPNLLIQLQRQFDSGNMSTKLMAGDPHVAASLLKAWLRALPEPVIPTSTALDTINKVELAKFQRALASTEPAAPKKAVGEDLVMAMFGKLAAHNQAILSVVIGLLKDVASNTAKTHMTFDSLAASMLGCFVRTSADGPLELLQQHRVERQFLVCLFGALSKR